MKKYKIKDCILVWDHDETVRKASEFKLDNLYIDDIWNMRDTVGYTDTCVMVNVLSEDTFYFVTFSGLGFHMQYFHHEMVCLRKQITK